MYSSTSPRSSGTYRPARRERRAFGAAAGKEDGDGGGPEGAAGAGTVPLALALALLRVAD